MKENGKGYKVLILLTYICMILLGLIENIKGMVIPTIREEFMVDYSQIGRMLFLTTLGYLTSTFIGGIAIEKFGLKKVLMLGTTFVILSTYMFAEMRSFGGVAFMYYILGLGVGCFEVGLHALGAKIFIRNAALMMNLMHFFYGVGSVIAPKYTKRFIGLGYEWGAIYKTTIVISLIIFILIVLVKFPKTSQEQEGGGMPFVKLVSLPKVWLVAFILSLLIMMENGMSSWLANYLQVARGLDVGGSTVYLTRFFVLFTFGRLIGGYISDKMGYIKSLIYFTVLSIIFIFSGVLLPEKFIILFSVVGFFVSIMFPTVMVIIMKEFSEGVGAIMGFVITVCGIFTMIGHWVIGYINDMWGVSVGMVSLGVCGVGAVFLLLLLNASVADN